MMTRAELLRDTIKIRLDDTTMDKETRQLLIEMYSSLCRYIGDGAGALCPVCSGIVPARQSGDNLVF